MTVGAAKNEDSDWISVSDLARERGVSQPAISKRIKAFSKLGQLTTRQHGRSVLIHRPTFEALATASHDPAQDLRNRHQRAEMAPSEKRLAAEKSALADRADAVAPPAKDYKPSVYDEASAREKNAKAELAEMRLAQERGELIRVRELEPAAVIAGTKIAQAVSAMKAKSGRLYAAAATGGEEALHVELVKAVNDVLKEIGDSMAQLASRSAEQTG